MTNKNLAKEAQIIRGKVKKYLRDLNFKVKAFLLLWRWWLLLRRRILSWLI